MKTSSNLSNGMISLLGKNSLIYAFGEGISKGINFLLIPYLLVQLSTESYGLISIASSVYMIASVVFSLQINGAIATLYHKTPEENRNTLISSSLLLILVISTVLCGLSLFVVYTWPKLFLPDTIIPQEITLSFVIGWSMVFTSTNKSILNLEKKPILYVSLSLFNNILYAVLLILNFTLFSATAINVLFALLAANLFTGAISFYEILRRIHIKINLSISKELILLALPLLIHSLSHILLNNIDRLLLSGFVDLDQIAIYQLGYQIGVIYQVIIIAINLAWAPIFYDYVRDMTQHTGLKKAGTFIIFGQGILAVFMILFRYEIINLIAPDEYLDASMIANWVILAYFCVAIYHLYINILISEKMNYLIPIGTISAVTYNIISNLLLMPHFGILAAAFNSFISFLILMIITYVLTQKKRAFTFPSGKLLIIFLSTIGFAVLDMILGETVFILRILIAVSFILIMYLFKIWHYDDIKQVLEIFSRKNPA